MKARRVMIVVPDLFFETRIRTTAKALEVVVVASEIEAARDACRAEPPDLLILELHASGDPLRLVRELKADVATRTIPVLGFYSHVDTALRDGALKAGVDHVLPQSAFTMRLADWLRGQD